MPEAHFTYYIKVADGSASLEPKFFISGEGSAGWEEDWTKELEWHAPNVIHNCSGVTGMKVYKFDQSDLSNLGHPFYLSETSNGTHNGGIPLSGDAGVYHCGTPGSGGASTKFNLWEFTSVQTPMPVYPYCPNYADFGGESEFTMSLEGITGEECISGDYECTGCKESYFNGQLNTLISDTNVELSTRYSDFTTMSYSSVTGVQTGKFFICSPVATGLTATDALLRVYDYQLHFVASGICIDDAAESTSVPVNLNGNTVSFSSHFTGWHFTGDGAPVYYYGLFGFADNRFYVGYNPQISGNNTGISLQTVCPTTDIQVRFDRNRKIYDTTGTIALPEDSIIQFITSMNATCTGWEATLSTACLKFYGGWERFGAITFSEDIKDAWSGYLSTGAYSLRYLGGSFTTSLGMHTLGSGTINADKYV